MTYQLEAPAELFFPEAQTQNRQEGRMIWIHIVRLWEKHRYWSGLNAFDSDDIPIGSTSGVVFPEAQTRNRQEFPMILIDFVRQWETNIDIDLV